MLLGSSDSPFERPEPAGPWAIVLISAVSALLVVLLLALLAPRFVADYTLSWPVTIGAGVLALITVLAIGFLRRARYQATGWIRQDEASEREESVS